jgi:hypothetical protein
MVVTFFGKGRIIFLQMDKFQWWIIRKDVEWAKHVVIFDIFSVQLNLIWLLVKEFL